MPNENRGGGLAAEAGRRRPAGADPLPQPALITMRGAARRPGMPPGALLVAGPWSYSWLAQGFKAGARLSAVVCTQIAQGSLPCSGCTATSATAACRPPTAQPLTCVRRPAQWQARAARCCQSCRHSDTRIRCANHMCEWAGAAVHVETATGRGQRSCDLVPPASVSSSVSGSAPQKDGACA